MRTGASGALALMAVLIAAPALAAQEHDQDYTWRGDRPDGYAPIGVWNDYVLAEGEVQFGYRLSVDNFDGLKVGEFEVTIFDVLDVFASTPINSESVTHTVSAAFSPMDRVTLMAQLPIRMINTDQLDRDGFLFASESSSLGDIRVDALASVYNVGAYRAHVSGGISLPTGSIDEEGLQPGGEGTLPYALQVGSGTVDFHPGLTVEAMNEHGSVGLQAAGTLRMGENDRGYTRGNRVEMSGWAGFLISEQMSLSARAHYQRWESVSGSDADLDGAVGAILNPLVFPELTGGSRLDLPIGINLHLRDGPLAGHRIGVEWVLPVSQDLDGPQLRPNWGLNFGWEKVVGW